MSAFGVRADIARSYDSDIHDRHLVDLVSLLVRDDDEPTSPIPARHDRAMFEVACKRHRIVASGGIARQVNAFVIVKNFVAVSEMEIVTRHGGSRMLAVDNSLVRKRSLAFKIRHRLLAAHGDGWDLFIL
jgi:hypothetical protein